MSESSAPPSEPRGARDGSGGASPPPVPPAAPLAGSAHSAHDPHGHHEDHGFRVWRMTKPVVLTMCALCLLIFWYAGVLLHVPAHRGYEASLLQQPGTAAKVLAVVAAGGLFVACAILVQLIAVRRWVLVGPFAAAVGLAAWSIRGGSSVYVYQRAATAGYGGAVFPLLLLELLLLFIAVGGVWWLLIRRMEALAEEAAKAEAPPVRAAAPAGKSKADDAAQPEGATLVGRLQGVLTQVAIIGLLTMLLAQTADKAQVLASVLIASLVGTGIAEHYFKDEKVGPWLWAGPLIVGALGYLLNWLVGDPALATETGRLTGWFAALARPLPLDYVSFGTAGALLGYWMGADKERLVGPAPVAVFGVGYLFLPDSIRNAAVKPMTVAGPGVPTASRAGAPPAPNPTVPGNGQVG